MLQQRISGVLGRHAFKFLLLVMVLAAVEGNARPQSLLPPPPTQKHPVVDVYHGVSVTDDYRWLEDTDAPTVKAWSDAQNKRTRAFLDGLPARALILQRLKKFVTQIQPVSFFPLMKRGGRWFAFKFEIAKNNRTLVTLASLDETSTEKLVFDPKALDPTGSTSVNIVAPSPDGKRVAISLSRNGSEIDTLHVYEVATGREVGDIIPRVSLASGGGSVSWNQDSSGFYYTHYPAESERPKADLDFYQQVYFHRLGTPIGADAYSVGKEFPRIAETSLSASPDNRYQLARVENGDGGEIAFYVMDPSGKWSQVAGYKDGVKDAQFASDDALYLRSVASAPKGCILRVPLATPTLSHARMIVPQGEGIIDAFLLTASRFYVLDRVGGPSQLRIFDLHGRSLGRVPILPVSLVQEMQCESGDIILFQNGSCVDWPGMYRYSPAMGRPAKITSLAVKPFADLSQFVVKQVFAVSRDGTRVPMHILSRKGLRLDGANPTLLTGYGGYGINALESSILPPNEIVWLENGGVVVHTGLRGGGEYGETWHLMGNLTKKQNVFDDFIACAQYLIAHQVTSPAKLAITGASNGGLLMGASLTQRPDLFRAVVSRVGMYDMLRFENSPNGSFNVTEFGSVKDADQFKALYAYSPYHHVVNETAYPAVLFMTGDNDGRVDPMNSRKMTARLQEANPSGHPILLRTSATSGHFMNSRDEAFGQFADSLAFLFNELAMEYRSPASAR